MADYPHDKNAIPFLDTEASQETHVEEDLDALSIKIDDSDLAKMIRGRVEGSNKYWTGQVDLWNRQKKIEKYLFGQQVDKSTLHPSQKPYMENVMWEGWVRNRSILMSRIPDIEVVAGDLKDQMSVSVADKLEMLVNTEIKEKENKRILSRSIMQREIYLYGVIKVIWDRELQDYKFISVNPKNIILDHTTSDPSKGKFICEKVKTTIEEVVMMFPKKKDEFLNAVASTNQWTEEDLGNNMASPLHIWEVWFNEYIKHGSEDGKDQYEKTTGTVWQYDDVILGKMKHPYWDWTGEKDYFVKDVDGVREPTEDEIYDSLFGDYEVESQTVFNNFMERPEFPYFIITLNEFGENCIDVTTSFEQILLFQDNINREGIQITTMNSRSYGKDAYSIDAFEDEATIEKIDPRDIDQVIKVKGEDIGKVYQHIEYPLAPAQLYESKRENRSIAFEMLALNATTRGTREDGDETLGARQMMREQDFGVLDYEVVMTLNEAVLWMSRWIFQLVKLFYKSRKYKVVLGTDGDSVREAFTRDMVDDGAIISVSASSVNKQRKYSQAVSDASAGMSDPLSYFEDTEQDNPKERAKRMMIFKMLPQMYMQEYLGDDGGEIAQALMQSLQQKPLATVPVETPQEPPLV